jgi:Stealth protein CR4, conserved region 4
VSVFCVPKAWASHACLCPHSFENIRELLRMFVKRPPKFFTFNDDWGEQDPVSSKFIFGEFLATLFPNPSQYELPTVRDCTECE